MKSRTSLLCKCASVATIVVTIILCIIKNNFLLKVQIAAGGLLVALLFASLASVIDKIL